MLDDDAIARYARQIVIPGFGAAGQQILLASRVLVLGSERGCRQAALYLRAAGPQVVLDAGDDPGGIDIVILAGAGTATDEIRAAALAPGKPLCWYVTRSGGFTSGVYPGSPLPVPGTGVEESDGDRAIDDAAACDAASVACAILAGLRWQSGPFAFEC